MTDIDENLAKDNVAARQTWSRYYNMYVAVPPGPGAKERLIAVAGAILGIGMTGLLCGVIVGTGAAHPLLVAPMGASAVLLFAVPASPLAQPWSILGGNVISAIVGIAVALAVPNATLAAGLGVGSAIAVMSMLRCLHPPGGAVALSAVLGGAASASNPFLFALFPVGLNSLMLIVAGMAFHRMSGHSYPHRAAIAPSSHDTRDTAPLHRTGVTMEDLDTALKEYGETLDVGLTDLQALFKSAEMHAAERQPKLLRCRDIMSRDVVAALASDRVAHVRSLLELRHLRAIPVLGEARQVLGIVSWSDLEKEGEFAIDVVSHADTASPDTPVMQLLGHFADGHGHEMIIVDDFRRMLGVITQTDVIAAVATGAIPTS